MLFVSFAVMFKQRLVLSRKQRKAQAKLCPGPPRQIWEPLMAHGSSQNVPHYLFWHLCRGCCMTKAPWALSSISSCISEPTDMNRSELKAETTCAEPPDNAATSLDTLRCISHQTLSHLLLWDAPWDKTSFRYHQYIWYTLQIIFTEQYMYLIWI